jgi:cytidylate kinase
MSRRSRRFIVAIDGPAGSGKSTTARMCAEQLGFDYLDTGAMYRAITLKVLATRANLRGRRSLAALLNRTSIDLEWQQGRLCVRLDGRDVSEAIRRPDVSGLVSEVSAIPAVRRVMVALQRRMAHNRELVCEGRDIGSVVFPDAELKVFLDCDVAERAKRREDELTAKGTAIGRSAVRANLVKRDRIDSGRRMSPLRRVPDAVLVDTTYLSIVEQVAVVCALVRARRA